MSEDRTQRLTQVLRRLSDEESWEEAIAEAEEVIRALNGLEPSGRAAVDQGGHGPTGAADVM